MKNDSKIQVLQVVPSKSNPAKTYEIRRGKDETVYCTCPAWKFQRLQAGGRTCKHLKSFFASVLATKGEQLPVIPKFEAGHLLATAKKKEAAKKEAEARYQAAKKAAAACAV